MELKRTKEMKCSVGACFLAPTFLFRYIRNATRFNAFACPTHRPFIAEKLFVEGVAYLVGVYCPVCFGSGKSRLEHVKKGRCQYCRGSGMVGQITQHKGAAHLGTVKGGG